MGLKILKPVNPIVAFLLTVVTLGIYLLYWAPYLADNLNQISESNVVNKAKWKQFLISVLIPFLAIFVSLMILVPVSWGGVSEAAKTTIFIIFCSGFALVVIWNVSIVGYFCFINYKIDRLLQSNHRQFTLPWVSVFITVISFFEYFLFVAFTQYKMNLLIKKWQENKTCSATTRPSGCHRL